MNHDAQRDARIMSAVADALIPAARELAELMGGNPTAGTAALAKAHAMESARMAHAQAAHVAGATEIDREACGRDARIIFTRFAEMAAEYFAQRFGAHDDDEFARAVVLSRQARIIAESSK